MQQEPFELHYELTRRQRLGPHLTLWRLHAPLAIFAVIGSAAGAVFSSWWYLAPLLYFLFFSRGFFLGLLNVLLVKKQSMDIVVEDNGLGLLSGNERLYIFLDGLTAIEQLMPGVWTIRHWNGSYVNIPAELLNDEQVEFFRAWVARANEIRRDLGIHGSSAA